MTETTTLGTANEVVEETLEVVSSRVIIAFREPSLIQAVAEELGESSVSGEVQLIAPESTLKTIRDDFRAAGMVADRVDEERLTIRASETQEFDSFVASESEFTPFLRARQSGDSSTDFVAIHSDDTEPAAEFWEHATALWDSTSDFNFRLPPLSTALDKIESTVGDGVRQDLERVVSAEESPPLPEGALDKDEAILLLAARNECVHYDVGVWGQETGFASKATFSRKKSGLEDAGVVETEKVPVDVGRPRQRLLLESGLEELGAIELLETVESSLD